MNVHKDRKTAWTPDFGAEPKSEARNPKAEGNSKFETRNARRLPGRDGERPTSQRIRISGFGLLSGFDFRNSTLSFSKQCAHPILRRPCLDLAILFGLATNLVSAQSQLPKPPYPPSLAIQSITWHWETHRTAAPGSDLWPVTWGPDDHLYAAWGDGGGFGGSDSDGRVSMGFARLEAGPEDYRGINVNGGKNPEHPASFLKKGKTGGILFVDGTLYASINLQDGPWPNVNHVLAWSTDRGATWTHADWLFPKGVGNFQPAKFLNCGRDYTGLPAHLDGFVYLYGPRQAARAGEERELFLARVPKRKLQERAAYQFFEGFDKDGKPRWTSDAAQMQPVFTDSNGVTPGTVVYDPGIKRFLLTSFHTGPGQLGVFDAPEPWGPWTTVAYDETWGGMGATGEGLTCEFPQKWMSTDGLTLWSVFSVYGEGAKQGIQAHDRFNLVKATLKLTSAQTILPP